MVRFLALAGMVSLSLTVAWAQDDDAEEDKKINAKEIVYEQPTEWSVYPADEPVVAFAIRGDELWYATASSVYCASIKKRLVQPYAMLGTMPGTDVTCMTTDGNTVWIGGKNGVAMRGAKDFTIFTAENGLPDNAVTAIAGGGGKIWAGTEKGLGCYSGGSWKKFTTANGLSADKVTAIVVDDNNKVWVGTLKGISVSDGASWTIYDMKKKNLSWNNVKALTYDPRKYTVWAAVGDRDINSFVKGKWSTFMDIQSDITSLMVDTQSRLWVGSSNGLIKYNGDEWINDPKKLNIPAAQVQCMHRDEAGNLYFACENGIVRLVNPYPF
jgi:ligand-binding sensor domain-containing protein